MILGFFPEYLLMKCVYVNNKLFTVFKACSRGCVIVLTRAGTILHLADPIHITIPEMRYDMYQDTLHIQLIHERVFFNLFNLQQNRKIQQQ